MSNLIKRLYWLGLIGLIGTFFDVQILKLFYLFFLLGIVDSVLSFINSLQTRTIDKTINDLTFLF